MRMTVREESNVSMDVRVDGTIHGHGSSGLGSLDHRRLQHRDSSEQHPIGAITNLDSELATRPNTVITDAEINAL